MPEKVEIISKETVFQQAIFRVEQATLRYETYAGEMSDERVRLSLQRDDAAAAVVHDITNDTLLFTEQFRYPTHTVTGGWLTELPAGMIEPGEDPGHAMRRELVEEIGYEVATLHPLYNFFLSPGGSSERIYLFYARVRPGDKTHEGGGVSTEGEDIRTLYLPLAEVEMALNSDRFIDAKTIIGLQWLLINRYRLEMFQGSVT
jgi:nudix-type nucleoside diphosphatase (YffH/AdpP family)